MSEIGDQHVTERGQRRARCKRHHERLERPARPKWDDSNPVRGLKHEPPILLPLALDIVEQQRSPMRGHVVLLARVLTCDHDGYVLGSPDLAMWVRTRRTHHFAAIFEYLYPRVISPELGRLASPRGRDLHDVTRR